ncbi:WXG100 family type VII secretion target [Actinosynnema sp. CS-041913]|uniref:WXG100 family type VII secretion target n=1 Tax=Actinosynnema sp. CS-041913 TaxID=3239917 RepID=UPI003D8EA1D1
MSGGYAVDPDELAGFADRLADTADELRTTLSTVDEPVGDLGPEGVTEAVTELLAEWSDTLRGLALTTVADEVRTAGETYRQADELPHD